MIKNPRNLLWMVPLALLVTAPLWWPAMAAFLKPRGGYDPELAKIASQMEQNFIMDSLTITLTSNGRMEWIINAERAFTGDSDKEIKMEGVDAVHFSESGERSKVISDRGSYFVNDRHLILADNVVLQKPASMEELFSDLLHYYDEKKMVVSPGKVEIRGPKFTIRAGKMDYDLITEGYDLGNRVHSTF